MPAPRKSKAAPEQGGVLTSIMEIHTDIMQFHLLGISGLIHHRLNEKARRELLFPKGKTNQAEREQTLKHDPLEEYRSSAYVSKIGPTRLVFPGGAFKKALASAALDIPGTFKTTMERLTSVVEINVSIYGVPQLHGAMTRLANGTPDPRFRCCQPEWACSLSVRYVSSLIRPPVIANLLAAAGTFIGVGDNRQQKGGGYGLWRIVNEDDAELRRIMKQGRRDQEAALASPEYIDEETEELVGWFLEERKRREQAPSPSSRKRELVQDVVAIPRRKRAGNGAPKGV